MEERIVSEEQIREFEKYLVREEKSTATMEKYLRDVRAFFIYAGHETITKELAVEYKRHLQDKGYKVRSINSMLASINGYFEFQGWRDCKVKSIRQQKETYLAENKELTKKEYCRLLQAAEKSTKLNLVMQTICGTGIRVSELQHFTVEEVQHGEVHVDCKGKNRTILIPGKLRKKLLAFAKRRGIHTGTIFLGRNGKPLNRSSIWAQMKALCVAAHVSPGKVFPHNLRKLFARTFYGIEKDIAKLADILGHSSIDTTRIYIMTPGAEHRRKIERLGLVI